MSDSDSGGLQSMFGGTGEKAVVTNEYRSVATSNITDAVDRLNLAQSRLSAEQSRLQSTQSQATAALDQVIASRQEAEATVGAQEATLAEVKGQIATLVAQQQAAAQAQQFAAFQKRVAASTAPVHAPKAPNAPAAPTALPHRPSLSFRRREVRPPPWPPPGASSVSPTTGRGIARCRLRLLGLTAMGLGPGRSGHPPHGTGAVRRHRARVVVGSRTGRPRVLGLGPRWYLHVGIYVGGGDVIHAPETGELGADPAHLEQRPGGRRAP